MAFISGQGPQGRRRHPLGQPVLAVLRAAHVRMEETCEEAFPEIGRALGAPG